MNDATRTSKEQVGLLDKCLAAAKVAHREPFNVAANIAYCDARMAVLAAMGAAPEPPAARKTSKFDLAFEIMRRLEAEDMETMQSCQFGYVMRVTREGAPSPPADSRRWAFFREHYLDEYQGQRVHAWLMGNTLRAGGLDAAIDELMGVASTKPACQCGHPFAPNHQTPGTECSVEDCQCGRYRTSGETSVTTNGDQR